MVTSSRPICVKCNVEMRCTKNGAVVEHMCTDGPKALQAADKYECPSCKIEVISGFGQQCLADSWQSRYRDIREYEVSVHPITQSWMTLSDKEAYERQREARAQVSAG